MRKFLTGILMSSLVLLAVPVAAQECGDANGDGSVNIGDIVMIIDGIMFPDVLLDPDFYITEADCDGRAGITIADAVAIVDYAYRNDDHRDCSAGLTYSMTLSESDTIFIPYINDIPSNVYVVDLPIMMSLSESVEGVYIPLHTDATVTNNQFALTAVDFGPQDGYISAAAWEYPTAQGDSCMIQIYELTEDRLAGLRNTYSTMEFTRNGTAIGSIAPTEYLRSSLMRITVERNGDLFVPVIVFYNVELPDPVLSVDPTSLAFTAESGETPIDTYEINFTSTGQPVTFDLDVSQSWVVLDGDPVGPFTTPASFSVSVDGTTLFPGPHTATITPINLDPAEAVLTDGVVSVDFTVTAPANLPWGDINCDGNVSIGDVSLLIDCLFINARPVPDCR
ncbi:MAG: hypothetical protein J7J98_04485 [candidate division Zixibacteria bacterium]|nr:hypothetical protein [candidate division Zixibacteria bacterium]